MNAFVLSTKPLSVNVCWQGRRFKTKLYTNYEKELGYILNRLQLDKIQGYVTIKLIYHLINWKKIDVDNLIKPLIDILVKNNIIDDDRFIMEYHIFKKPAKNDRIEVYINKFMEEIKEG